MDTVRRNEVAGERKVGNPFPVTIATRLSIAGPKTRRLVTLAGDGPPSLKQYVGPLCLKQKVYSRGQEGVNWTVWRGLSAMDRRIEVAIEIIRVELGRKMTVAYLAKRVNLSPWRFCHLFKAETSVTAKQFVRSCRLGKAKELLANSFLTVKEIAAKVGFDDRSHFTRAFKESAGQSPKRYRSLAPEHRSEGATRQTQ